MWEITTGKMIRSTREAQKVSTGKLVEGLCSRRTLQKFEEGKADCEMLLFVILLQRLGKSADKLEYILTWRDYRLECILDWFIECVFRKRKKWAERAIELYWEKTEGIGTVHRMYLCRGRAMIAYWIDGDAGEAEKWLERALDATFPRWRNAVWNECCISTMELENALALARMQREQGKRTGGLLKKCGDYINRFVTDGEEHAKIFGKYAWLEAAVKLEKGCAEAAMELCLNAVEELRQYGIEYFMRPLLMLTLRCHAALEKKAKVPQDRRRRCREAGVRGSVFWISRERCSLYLQILERMHQQFGEAWYPESSLLCNSCQKSYYLDYELLYAERCVKGITQERMADGIYHSSKTVGEIERVQSMTSSMRLIMMLEKLGMKKERRNGYVITSSFETLELRKEIQVCAGRQQYDMMRSLLRRLEQQLDLGIFENYRAVQLLRNAIDMASEMRPCEEMLAEDWELLDETYCYVPQEWKNGAGLAPPPKNKLANAGRNPGLKMERLGRKRLGRAPMKNEADVINQIAILMKKLGKDKEALRLYEWTLETFERSRVNVWHRFLSYGLLLGNAAAEKCSIQDSSKAMRHSLRCGRLCFLGSDYMTFACAQEDDPSKHELCRRMIRDAYYLFDLSYNYGKQSITKKYYATNYGGDVEEN